MEDRVNTTSSRRCVDCLVVKKVYDACSRRECLESLPFELGLPSGCLNDYTLLHTEFGSSIIEPYEKEPLFTEKDDCYARLKCVVGIPVYMVIQRNCDRRVYRVPCYPLCNGTVQKDNVCRFPVEITVYAPRQFLRQGRFEPLSECLTETGCITCLNNGMVALSLGFFIIINIVTDVSLKVPNFGYCEAPPECEDQCDENFCENFLDQCTTPFPRFFPEDLG